jgi:copper chaperone NosL
MRRLSVLLVLAALAVGCDKSSRKVPQAQEMTPSAVAEFCGMSLREHAGPKAQIFVQDREAPYWFASVHDMFAFTMLPEEPRDIRVIYVSDMGRAHDWAHPEPGTWIDAHKAIYVIGSRRRSGMDEPEAVPFGDPDAAKGFIAANGGRMVSFREMPADYIFPGRDNAQDQSR